MSPEEITDVIRNRRTIKPKQFSARRVDDGLIQEILENANWAPTHGMTEPWRFILPGEETIARIVDLCAEIVSAQKGPELGEHKRKAWCQKPGWLIVTCRYDDDKLREREDYAACSAAVQNFMLYLWKAGIGSKWTSGAITRDERLFEIIGADPESEFIVGMIWFGYPKITPSQTRRPVDEVLTKLP